MLNNQQNKVEILCIGTELLLGNILNGNAKWLAEELAAIGLPHFRQTVVGDNFKNIQEVVRESSKRCNLLITTGGLGPTPDDLTTEAIATAFNKQLVESEKVLHDIKQKVKNSIEICPTNNYKQALFPEDSIIIPNQRGTAPGMIWSPLPDFTIMTFPGVPSEMKEMWSLTAMKWLANNINTKNTIVSRTLRFAGISESSLAEKIDDLLNNKNPTVAPYASLGEVKIRITAQARNKEDANNLIKPVLSDLTRRTGDICFSKNEETLAEIVINFLKERKETLAVAESCTGGKLGGYLTSIPGSSKIFRGGVIAYSNYTKQKILGVRKELIEEFGAVSKEVVKAMAAAAKEKIETDWAIAISGIAGPAGDTKSKSIGNVQFGIAGPNLIKSISVDFGAHRGRIEIQDLSVMKALNELRLILLKET